MFKRKDVMPVLFLVLLILTLMVTLSQILVVHHHNHPKTKPRDTRKFQTMLRQLEESIASMMKTDVLSSSAYERSLVALVYSERIKTILCAAKGSQPDKKVFKTHLQTDNKVKYKLNSERKSRFLQHLDTREEKRVKNEQFKNISKNIETELLTTKSILNKSRLTDDATGHNEYIKGNHMLREKIGITNVVDSVVRHKDSGTNNLALNTFNKISSPNHTKIGCTLKSQYSKRKQSGLTTRTIECQSGDVPDVRPLDASRTPYMPSIKPCPEIPDALVGRLNVRLDISSQTINNRSYDNLEPGGMWRPRDCIARHHVAIIIPYRDRRKHLEILLYYLVPILQKQQLDFQIFVVEQAGNLMFNKGRIMNAAFKEAWKMSDFQCFIFHDVDLIPEDDRNMYTCSSNPRHMSVAVDKFNYRGINWLDPGFRRELSGHKGDKLPYYNLVGGVLSVRREDFVKMNGYSNLYWGWGAEDDDMYIRMTNVNLTLTRPSITVGRYIMVKHRGRVQAPWKWRTYLLKTVHNRFRKDGLNSLDYKVEFVNNTQLYTHLMVDIGEPPKGMPKI